MAKMNRFTNPFERLVKISKRVPQTTERLTLTIISPNDSTSQQAAQFLLEWNFYCIVSIITAVCKHASRFGTLIFSKTTSRKQWADGWTGWRFQQTGDQAVRTADKQLVNRKLFENGKPLKNIFPCEVTFKKSWSSLFIEENREWRTFPIFKTVMASCR